MTAQHSSAGTRTTATGALAANVDATPKIAVRGGRGLFDVQAFAEFGAHGGSMRISQAGWLLVAMGWVSVACSGARANDAAAPAQIESVASTAPSGSAPLESEGSGSGAPAAPAAESDAPGAAASPPEVPQGAGAAPQAGAHCPAGMLFISGDYCADVEHRCLKQWHSAANDKQVCEAFEPWSKCIGEKTPKRFCVDDFPWPNQAGERPEVMNNFYQAQVKCAAVGKRLCTESEWTMACEGPDLKPFPYGYVRDTNKCNGDRPWDRPNMTKVAKRDPEELARLWQGVPNGSQPLCVSDYKVHDLPGNNDEVAASETVSQSYRGKFDSVTTGGPWYKGVRNQCRPKIYTHNEGFYYYYLGFRCCSEPDGATTDPRAPKQIQRGWSFERVESLARFSVEDMKAKLQAKAQGKCTCADKDVLCKTMCGTLLGPSAKDVQLGKPTPEPLPPGKAPHLKTAE